ncbi:MAG: hypothetical protein HY812_08245 [Planctomycetes bacterium]|nr:hypothetical protein [Planctomycetota bacterium]
MTPAHASEAGSARRPLLPLRRGEVAVCVVSSAVLLLELCLVRLFDVLLNPSLGYVVLSCALFSLGFAGFFLALRPRSAPPDLLRLSILLAAATVLILPALGAIRFDLESIAREPLRQA